MKYNKIDPNIELSSVPLFKLVAIALPLIALICLLVILINSNLIVNLSHEGFNHALFTVSKVPLALLAACVTILGVIAAIHRSAQITLQIEKTSEQNIFSNYYAHRQEYVEHFNDIKNDLPEHIKDNILEKVIRGYYSSTYPFNCSSRFTVKFNFGWIDTLDEGLIELSYILLRMNRIEDTNLTLEIYREFLNKEVSIRQDLFNIARPENAVITLENSRNVFIHYWNDLKYEIAISSNLFTACFSRIRDYAEFLTKLKYLVGGDEATILYGISVYSELSTIADSKKFNETSIARLCASDTINVKLSEKEYKDISNVFKKIAEIYEKKIHKLRILRKAGSE